MKFTTGLRFMIHPAARFLAGMIALVCGTIAMASVFSGRELKLDFTDSNVVQQASWTQSVSLKLGPNGLSNDALRNSFLPFQLQTTDPIAIGVYWWPAQSASILATLNTSNTDSGHLFARYSPDTKHWSTWQAIARQGPIEPTTQYTFSGELTVPQQEFGAFAELCNEHQGRGPRDAEACVGEILKSQPDYFAKHQPFVGYVQFLYEADFWGGRCIEQLDINIFYGVAFDRGRSDIPWHFRAQ
jgi:hypothetical protein